MTTREQAERVLAEHLSLMMQARRLARIGEPVPEDSIAFDALPEEDRRNWADMAACFLDLLDGTLHSDSPSPTGEGFTVCQQPEHMHIARAAEAMAAAIDVMCHRKLLDERSFPADARLMLGDPWGPGAAVEILKRYRPHPHG